MTSDLSQKEILIRLMDKVDAIDTKLERAVTTGEATLKQAEKTNGRVTKLEDEVDTVKVRQENLGVKVAAGVFILSAMVSTVVNRIL